MDRAQFLRAAAAAGAAVFIPVPLARALEQPEEPDLWHYPEFENGWQNVGMARVLVRRGNMARLNVVSPEFLEDAAARPYDVLAEISKRDFLRLQAETPGNATLPVHPRRRYRLEPFDSWTDQFSGSTTTATRLVGV